MLSEAIFCKLARAVRLAALKMELKMGNSAAFPSANGEAAWNLNGHDELLLLVKASVVEMGVLLLPIVRYEA